MANHSFHSELRKKVARLRRARQKEANVWRYFAKVGVLGFTFVLPALLGALAANWLKSRVEARAVVLFPLVLGVFVGAYLVWRQVRTELKEEDDD